MTIEKQMNGSILITDIIDDMYFKQGYYDYTLKEAKAMFRAYVKNELSKIIRGTP